MAISLLENKRKEIAEFMENNPNMSYEDYMKHFNCSRPQILKIRRKYNLGKRTVSHLSEYKINLIKEYMIENPLESFKDLCIRFNCNLNQIGGIRKRYGIKKYETPQAISEDDAVSILDYMKQNPTVGHEKIGEMFGYTKTQILCFRKKHDLPSVNECRRKEKKIVGNWMKPPKGESLEDFLNFKLNKSKYRSKMKVDDEHTLTYDDLLNQYNKQNGKCYYTGRVMDLRINSINSLSIDRIDSGKNYSKDNIVLCCSIVNFMKKKSNIQDFIDACIDVAKNHAS